MEMAWKLFGSKMAYVKFHDAEDKREYLEIKEDLEKYREEAAQRAIGDVCRRYGIVDGKEIYARPEIFKEIVKEIRKNSKMSRLFLHQMKQFICEVTRDE